MTSIYRNAEGSHHAYQARFLVSSLLSAWLALALFAPYAAAQGAADLPGFRPSTGDFDGMQERRVIRILVPYSKTIYLIDGRSPRGAVGIMQLLPSTAAGKEAGIAESAERNIEAGAKYLRHLSEVYVTGDGPKPLDRMLLTLAAYNAGPGNLRKFRKAATDMGLSPDAWFGNVENGAARIVGRETVQYVGNIYKYYVAYSMYAEQRRIREDEAENGSVEELPEAAKE